MSNVPAPRPMRHDKGRVVRMVEVLAEIDDPKVQLDTLAAVVRCWTDAPRLGCGHVFRVVSP